MPFELVQKRQSDWRHKRRSRDRVSSCSRGTLTLNGDEGIRTLDPLLARQVLSQLSYAPKDYGLKVDLTSIRRLVLLINPYGLCSGLKWTRTTDLTLIRRAL